MTGPRIKVSDRTRWFRVLALWLLLPVVAAAQYEGNFPLAEGAGVIQELDFAAQTMVIDGMRYEVAVDVKVEIGGSYGAYTLLETGMNVYIEFLRISDEERRIVLVRELPTGVEPDQV